MKSKIKQVNDICIIVLIICNNWFFENLNICIKVKSCKECYFVSGWVWTRKNFLNIFHPCQKNILWHFLSMWTKYFLIYLNILSHHQPFHVVVSTWSLSYNNPKVSHWYSSCSNTHFPLHSYNGLKNNYWWMLS